MKYALWLLALSLVSCGGAGDNIHPSKTEKQVFSEPRAAAKDTETEAANDTAGAATDSSGSSVSPDAQIPAAPTANDDVHEESLPAISYRFEVPVEACDGSMKQKAFGPELITHPHPDGSVSIDDVSLNNWLEECPVPPLLIVPETKKKQFNQEQFKHNLMCAILWGNWAEAQDALDECTVNQSTKETCPPVYDPKDSQRRVYQVKKPAQCADKAALQKWIENPPKVTLSYDELSICGTITSAGYRKLSFLVPENLHSPVVKRYEVIELGNNFFPPLDTNDGWWVCATEGRLISEPEEEDAYGKILIIGIDSVEGTGEKGME